MTQPQSITDKAIAYYDQRAAGDVSSVSVDAANGNLFVANSGRLTIAAAGNFRAAVTNNTTKSMRLIQLSLFSTVNAFTSLYLNPTAGVPTASRPVTSMILSTTPTTNRGQVFADSNTLTALSGGTDLGIAIGLGAGRRESIQLPPLFLLPGQTLGLNVNLGAAADGSFSIYWINK